MKKMLVVFIIIFNLFIAEKSFSLEENCTGNFVNPVTDICWDCLFPITIGNKEIASGSRPDTSNFPSPICACPLPVPRIGITTGFWEPARMVDVTKRPYCFVNLGGKEIDVGAGPGKAKSPRDDEDHHANWHVHWYVYPLLSWLNFAIELACMQISGFDIAYISELDPLWQDDELTYLINPESILFIHPIAGAACAADCISSTVDLPIDLLFWCAGCHGSMYPLNGNVQAHNTSIQSSLLAVERMTYKLHRQGILWGSMGKEGLCTKYPMPIMKKSQYRSQLLNPVAMAEDGGCYPFGYMPMIYEYNKELPIVGEDFGYLIWRKRNCCIL